MTEVTELIGRTYKIGNGVAYNHLSGDVFHFGIDNNRNQGDVIQFCAFFHDLESKCMAFVELVTVAKP